MENPLRPELLPGLAPDNYERAVKLANLPDPIRTLVWPWLQPHMSWLSVDDRITGANLSKVRSEQIDLAPLRRFTQLGSLVLHGRHVGPGLKRMTGVDSLYGLRVTGLQSTSDLGELRHLSSLDLLDITTCPDSGGGFEHLSLVSKLKRVSFNGPPSSVALQGVGQCPELEAVVMSGGIANEDDLRFLSDMKGLRELRAFGGNPAGAKGLKHIVRISSLERLVLNQTSVTDHELQALTALPKLKWLYVRGPNLSQAGTDRLNDAIPNCKIDGP